MTPTRRAQRLTVYVDETRQVHHRPVYAEIVRRAHAAGLAGASAFRGFEGYGASSRIHTARVLSLSEDLPVAVVVVDSHERVRAFLPELSDLLGQGEGVAVLDDVEVVEWTGATGERHEHDGPDAPVGREPA